MGARKPASWHSLCAAIAAVMLMAGLEVPAQSTPAGAAPSQASAELISRENLPTFKLQVQRNLVLVRAVVRDSNGRPLGNLQKDDFRLYDNGKPQTISHFSVESAAAKATELARGTAPTPDGRPESASSSPATAIPHRYLALYFDDVHMPFEEIAQTRQAAERYLAESLQPADRAGIFTSSGQGVLDFTDDRVKIHEALLRLTPRPVAGRYPVTCPDILEYQAYLMVEQRDPEALEVAAYETYQCRSVGDTLQPTAQELAEAQTEAEAQAYAVMNSYQTESEATLRGIELLVRRMAALPGQRNIVLVSPGFLSVGMETQVSELVDRALRMSVVVNTLDSRGLYAPVPGGDATHAPVRAPLRADLGGKKLEIELASYQRAADVLDTVASGTGGEYFHDNNDFNAGFRMAGSLPAAYYLLAFSPAHLKLDGRFHTLKVVLVSHPHFTVQARRGYFAPQQSPNSAEQARQEIQDAVFSQEEMNEIPIDIHTQFFKVSGTDAKLSVLTHLDLRGIPFRKEQDRSVDTLTVTTALFDQDGKYMTSNQKLLEFHLREATLARIWQSGLNMKTSFDVKAGTYLVRQVVRDSEGAQISGISRTVEIPN